MPMGQMPVREAILDRYTKAGLPEHVVSTMFGSPLEYGIVYVRFFRAYQHQRSLALIMNDFFYDYDGQ